MNPVFDIGGTTGMLLLAAPLLLLGTALMWALFWPGLQTPAPSQASPRPPRRDRSPSQTQQKPSHQQSAAGVRWQPQSNGDKSGQYAVEPPPPSSVLDDVFKEPDDENVDPRILEARQHFDQAMRIRERGDEAAAADCLRKTIMLASAASDNTLHARARLELGDICKTEGDLITACEHWQMARSLFEDNANVVDAEVCEKRMLGNGCPTDWVLTDF